MDFQRNMSSNHTRRDDGFQVLDSCDHTRVPNSLVSSPPKSTSTSIMDGKSSRVASLDALEKGHIESITSAKPSSRLARHFRDDVKTEWTDMLLLLCWFTTGFLDSTVFNAYGTFVSMQTGNTVLMGLGASNSKSSKHPYRWAKSLTSLVFYVVGCLFFSSICRKAGVRRRSTLCVSFLFQSIIIIVSAAVVQHGVVEGRLDHIINDIDWRQLIPIALLSFQAPGQVSGSRQLGFVETPTVVVTTMIYDFASDPALSVGLRKNPVRNRRFFGFLAITLGALAGGFVTINMGEIHVTLWVAAAIKASIALAWAVWPRQRTEV